MDGNAARAEQDAAKLSELATIVQAVKDRVRARYPQTSTSSQNPSEHPPIQVPLADLLPILHARDAAQARVASLGSVNPRPPGLKNDLIQAIKRLIARALGWFVRDQILFNRETVGAIEAILESLNEQNRAVMALVGQANEQITALRAETQELKDIRKHWSEWRAGWEHKLATNEVYFLRAAADLQGSFQHHVSQLEANLVERIKLQHSDYLGALDRANLEIQKRLWEDLARVKAEYERLIHTELRLIRLRGMGSAAAVGPSGADKQITPPGSRNPASPYTGSDVSHFDYSRFAERFRGSEEYVRNKQAFYEPFFSGCENVLDIGCGRGEFLQLMAAAGINARGIDLGRESVEQCRAKGLNAEEKDVFPFLASQPDEEFDGIFSAQVVEHIEGSRIPDLIRSCAAKLRKGGVLALETPNPECLAIFASQFFLDPTHTKPIPSALLSFYMQEAGFGAIEVHPLSPAIESMPELAELPPAFRNRFFGGLDYAILGRRL